MKHHSRLSSSSGSRGSALVGVLLFALVLFIIVGSVIGWSVNESRMSVRNAAWIEARDAAEATAEYGAAQAANLFNLSMNPDLSAHYLSNPPSTFFANSHVDTSKLEVQAGALTQIPDAQSLYYDDPTDENNAGDSMTSRYLLRRDLTVIAKATVNPPGNGGAPITAYVKEIISIRGAPLFSHAIFYSDNDLELQPTPQMDIYGPVHVNGDLYVSVCSTNPLSFHGPVTVAGNIYHAWSGSTNTSQEGGSGVVTMNQTTAVNFSQKSGTGLVSLLSGGVWKDSTNGADYGISGSTALANKVTTTTLAAYKTFVGNPTNATTSSAANPLNLATKADGIVAYNPMGFSSQVATDGSGNAVYANQDAADLASNFAGGATYGPHSLIDPPAAYPSSSDTYCTAKTSIEQQKLSRMAGLYVDVQVVPGVNGSPATAVVKLYGDKNTGTGAATDGPNGGKLLGIVPSNTINFVPYQATTSTYSDSTGFTATKVAFTASGSGSNWHWSKTTTTGGTFKGSSLSLQWNGAGNFTVTSGTPTYTGGTSATVNDSTSYPSQALALAAARAANNIPTTVATYDTGYSPTSSTTVDSTSSVTSGLYDRRQSARIDLVQVNMVALSTALTDMKNGTSTANTDIVDSSGANWGLGSTQGYNPYLTGTTGWNGGIYVGVAQPSGVTNDQAAVILSNGQTASGSSMVPFGTNGPNQATGLTIATNAPAYILGNFNADGTIATTGSAISAQYPDDGKTGASGNLSVETPTAIAADAVTILSPNYFGTGGSGGTKTVPLTMSSTSTFNAVGSRSCTTNLGPASGSSFEVAAALLCGSTATDSTGGTYSGGAHNLPRFLENWNGNTMAIRGSLVCMFKNKVATGPWSNLIYNPGSRQWGFDQIFQNGHFPPITPQVITYNRAGFTYLDAGGYASAAASF